MTNTSTNLITIIHENAHVALGMKDLYGFDVGGLDIGASTCEPDGVPPNDGSLFAPNAWHKLHWGWITPTVVTEDGFYDVRRADTTGDAFILYDPDRGTDDYFIAENRTRTPGAYDQSASGKGCDLARRRRQVRRRRRPDRADATARDVPCGMGRRRIAEPNGRCRSRGSTAPPRASQCVRSGQRVT